MSRFQILSLIGGGIRGSFTTSLLCRLEQKLGRPIAECFDLIAGTSTGGIIAAGLAAGKTAEEMQKFYVDYGAKIFTPREKFKAKGWLRPVYPIANFVFRKKTGSSLDAFFRSRFCPFALEEAFDIGFGDRDLSSIDFTRLIVPAVNVSKGEPHVFRSCHLPKGVHDRHIKISDVVIAATAAPTYFPHRQIGDDAFIDGGVWSVDPSLLAFAEATRVIQFENELTSCTDCDIKQIHLLSIGTGQYHSSLCPPGPDAGQLFWESRIADVMTSSQVKGVHFPMKFLLGDRYRHINFSMENQWPLDAVEHMPKLFKSGEQAAEENFEMLNQQFFNHTRSPFCRCESSESECQLKEFSF